MSDHFNFYNRYVVQPNASLVFETEWHFQKEVEKWREFEKDTTTPLQLLFAVPNGQYRKGQRPEPCMLSGVPDLFLSYAYNGYHGLYIELKHGSNKPSKEQTRVMKSLCSGGYCVEVCYSLEEVFDVVGKYLAGWTPAPF